MLNWSISKLKCSFDKAGSNRSKGLIISIRIICKPYYKKGLIPIPLEKGWGEQNNQRIKKKN